MRGVLLVLLAAAALSGCGSEAGGHGSATLWVTRDRGARVLLVRQVPAGLTASQALEREAKVKTRYGGRFVQSIQGLQGSASGQRDWFYFVNGYEADRSASEYTLRPGDVEWWDFRSWRGAAVHVPVVVGAFPEPFLHGYAGRSHPTIVVSDFPEAGRAVGNLLHARKVLPYGAVVPRGVNSVLVLMGDGKSTTFRAALEPGNTSPGSPVRVLFRGDWHDLVRRPTPFRFRYEVAP